MNLINVDVYEEIQKCRESIEVSVLLRDWNMVKAWEERLQFWIDHLHGLDEHTKH